MRPRDATHHAIEVRLILDTDRPPKDVLSDLVYLFALKPSKRVVVLEGLIRSNHRLLAAYEHGGEIV